MDTERPLKEESPKVEPERKMTLAEGTKVIEMKKEVVALDADVASEVTPVIQEDFGCIIDHGLIRKSENLEQHKEV